MHLTSSKPSKKMEIVEGKQNNKKIVFAQEIAFAKVLAGNNKTLRDRGIKKLKKWLEVRGNGKWAFTEEEFIRICTGLFYCMWMSDKFLVQEELAENISQLIHCFKKSSDNALLFIRTFNKKLLVEYEALDQYRIDKFNMLVRRFLRQTFVYCKRKNWDEKILRKVMNDFYEIILHRDNSLGFVIHFLNIYLEELAKVSSGKLDSKKVLLLLEPFVKLLASSKDDRIISETEQFFMYLMKQSDVGIEFDEKFNAWKKLGFPGASPHFLKKESASDNENFSEEEEDDEEEDYKELDKPLDPRAGSVHVDLPQIQPDFDELINLFKKFEFGKHTTAKGRRKIRTLIQKFSSLKKGKFPKRIKKDLILEEKPRKNKQTEKNAKELLEFTQKLDSEPIKSKEFLGMNKQLENEDEEAEIDSEEQEEEDEELIESESDNLDEEEEVEEEEENGEVEMVEAKNKCETAKKQTSLSSGNKTAPKVNTNNKNNNSSNNQQIKKGNNNNSNKNKVAVDKKVKTSKVKKKKMKSNNNKINGQNFQNGDCSASPSPVKKKKLKAKVGEGKQLEIIESPKEGNVKNSPKQEKIEKLINDSFGRNSSSDEPQKKVANKRKILSDWQVQDLDQNAAPYKRIKPQTLTGFAVKRDSVSEAEENMEPRNGTAIEVSKQETHSEDTPKKLFIPAFWDRAKSKVNPKKKMNDKKIFLNPFSKVEGNSIASGEKRISFALERNMAQENEEYLEEVRNSPKVPFDGSKMPVQSALKSGLIPSPINPFYRMKKIKF